MTAIVQREAELANLFYKWECFKLRLPGTNTATMRLIYGNFISSSGLSQISGRISA